MAAAILSEPSLVGKIAAAVRPRSKVSTPSWNERVPNGVAVVELHGKEKALSHPARVKSALISASTSGEWVATWIARTFRSSSRETDAKVDIIRSAPVCSPFWIACAAAMALPTVRRCHGHRGAIYGFRSATPGSANEKPTTMTCSLSSRIYPARGRQPVRTARIRCRPIAARRGTLPRRLPVPRRRPLAPTSSSPATNNTIQNA